MKLTIASIIASLALICASLTYYIFPTPAGAYNISIKGTIHEAMTRLAEACLAKSGGSIPDHCDLSNFQKYAQWKKQKRSDLEKASRWSDDPTHMIGTAGINKFLGLLLSEECKQLVTSTAKYPERKAERGLLCNSHSGDFQYLHAMATEPEKSPSITAKKMMEWTRLTYRVATNQVGPDVKYCDYFDSSNKNHGEKLDTIREDLRNYALPYCSERPRKFWFIKIGTYPEWRVHTLFSLKCKNPINSLRCTELTKAKGLKMARNNATGAILHMIQDSYSQSHAARGKQVGEDGYQAKIVCAPVTKFYEYKRQIDEKLNHSAADEFPRLDCPEDSKIHGPIKASAIALHYIEKGRRSDNKAAVEDELVKYLSEHVLGIDPKY